MNNKELRRQIVHMITGLTLLFLLYMEIIGEWTIFILLIIASVLSFVSLHFDVPFLKEILERYERDKDADRFPGRGPILMIVGILLSLRLFDQDIAYASIMFLSLGDSLSHLIGEHFGSRTNLFNKKGSKLLEGTIAGTLAGFLGALFFVVWYEALLGAVLAMVAEAVEIQLNRRPIDDNIIVPLAGGTAIHLFRTFFG